MSPAQRLGRSIIIIAAAAAFLPPRGSGQVVTRAAPAPVQGIPSAAGAAPVASQPMPASGQGVSFPIGALTLPSMPASGVSLLPNVRSAAPDIAAANQPALSPLAEAKGAKAEKAKAEVAISAGLSQPAERSGRVGSLSAAEGLRVIAASRLPALAWDSAKARWSAADPVSGDEAQERPAAAALSPYAQAPAKAAEPPQADSFSWKPKPDPGLRGEFEVRERTWLQRLGDKVSYRRSYLSSFFWRVTSRTTSTWEHFREKGERVPAERRAVRDLRGFFLRHLTVGSTGRYGIFGLRVTNNRIVFGDSWNVFSRYFQEDRASTAAFARFLVRAEVYNPNRRATQFRKIVQTALKDGAVLDIAELPAFFDGLATHEKGKALADYQKTRLVGDLELLDRLVMDTILEVNRGARKGERIAGALLMGSFANGAAGPSSDLDLQVVTEDGGVRHLPNFYARLQDRWDVQGKPNPIGGFQYALPLSRGFIDSMHQEPYLLFSPYPEVIEKLQRSAAEDALKKPSRVRGFWGDGYHLFYRGLLRASIFVDEIIGKLTHRPPRPPDH